MWILSTRQSNRSDVPQRLCAAPADGGVPAGPAVCVDDGGSADYRCVPSQHQAIRRYLISLPSTGPAQGQCDASVPAEVQEERGRAVRWQGPEKGAGHADRASPLLAHGSDLSVAWGIHGHGPPLLFLLHG